MYGIQFWKNNRFGGRTIPPNAVVIRAELEFTDASLSMRRLSKDGKSLSSEGIFESKKIREAPIPSISMINTTKVERIKGNILPETDIVVKMIILWIYYRY